jgi:CRISPR/Cas system-associated endonuclease Cas1
MKRKGVIASIGRRRRSPRVVLVHGEPSGARDAGLGFFHADTAARDSLACDVMEPVRSKVDAYVLDWIMSQPLKREWFFEQRDGNCRLMASFAVRLSETAPMWRHAVAPIAEYRREREDARAYIAVRVERGHLILDDGIGAERRHARLPRVGHGLRRLVIIGSDGTVSLAALRWLADQNSAFVMLEREGSVLATTGPVRSSDARLRRAQAMAMQTGVALQITRALIGQKLVGQERVARKNLLDSKTADAIARFRAAVATAETIEAICLLESQGASAYWAAWRDLPLTFPKADLPRVPDPWRTFSTRKSRRGSRATSCRVSALARNKRS